MLWNRFSPVAGILKPEGAQKGLCPPQPASERAGVLGPARPVPNHGIAGNIDTGLQKVGCASRPLRSVGHDLAHAGRHWVGIHDDLDRIAPVVRISTLQSSSR